MNSQLFGVITKSLSLSLSALAADVRGELGLPKVDDILTINQVR